MNHWTRSITVGVAMFLASSLNMWAGPQADHAQISEKVRKQIVTLPYYTIFDNIDFEYREDGVVELTGQVYRAVMKKTIERAAERVEGVNSVVNNIEILPVSFNDDRIRTDLARRIYGHNVFRRLAMLGIAPVRIVVKNGNVTLEGVVNSELEKNVAFHMANGTSGVFSVTNNLRTES